MNAPVRPEEPVVLALTMGEPAGVAPEITAGAWRALHARKDFCFFVIADAGEFARRAGHAGLALPVERISAAAQARACFSRALPVLHQPLDGRPEPGKVDAGFAGQVISAIDMAAGLAMDGKVDGMVTNPIQKESLYQAGFSHQGHTDYLAHLARARGHDASPVMMLSAKGLRTVPVTVHIALHDVPEALTSEMIVAQTRTVARGLAAYFALENVRIAVTGLNPHAGENGTMGHEERDIIEPAVRQLRADGLSVAGPLPADTVFHDAARARHDVVMCMYHDQALIPVKTLGFDEGVNTTLGLPFVRTSPDHGTALDLAGSGKASANSLIAALCQAAEMARNAR